MRSVPGQALRGNSRRLLPCRRGQFLSKGWCARCGSEVVVEKDKDGEQRINRVNYELCVLEAFQEGLRCRELWVVGANKYRNPDDDFAQGLRGKANGVL